MNDSPNNRQAFLARHDEMVVQELPDEVLVYDLKRHKAHCLNQAAAFVWNHCDGQTSVTEIAGLLAEELNKPVTEDIIWLALTQLDQSNLLQERIVKPSGGVNFSRRRAMRKVGQAALLTLPVVTSILVPRAVSAATIPPPCQACVKKDEGGCPTVCNEFIVGRCYDNAGCGVGQALACMTCIQCFSVGSSRSWRAPDTC